MTAPPPNTPPDGPPQAELTPGTHAYTQGLADWAYGTQQPSSPEEQTLWQECLTAHLSQLNPKERVVQRMLFRPFQYQQIIHTQAVLMGSVVTVGALQIIPRLSQNTDFSMMGTLPISLIIGWCAYLAFRDYQWRVWINQFQQLKLRPPKQKPWRKPPQKRKTR